MHSSSRRVLDAQVAGTDRAGGIVVSRAERTDAPFVEATPSDEPATAGRTQCRAARITQGELSRVSRETPAARRPGAQANQRAWRRSAVVPKVRKVDRTNRDWTAARPHRSGLAIEACFT
ncbi:hypothetical protein GCM10009573_03460 [Agromyces bracchium]